MFGSYFEFLPDLISLIQAKPLILSIVDLENLSLADV